jgi:RNA polymerase sigma-70 factor (ECF subfamily)
MDAVDRLWEAGRALHPSVRLSLARFTELVQARASSEDPPMVEHAGDLLLACASLDGEPGALRLLDDSLRQVAPAVRQIDGSTAFVDEVLQQVRDRLLLGEGQGGARPRLHDYAGRGPLGAWLRVAAVRTALNLRAKQARDGHSPLEEELHQAVDLDDPALALARQRCGAEFQAAFRAACEGLSERQRVLLRLRYVEDKSADDIAAIYGVHRATTTRWLTEARELVFERTRDELQARLELTPTEVSSMVRLVLSGLDVSLSRILGARIE